MANVQFDDQTTLYSRPQSTADRRPLFIKILINRGWAKDESSANRILIAVAIIAFLLACFITFKTIKKVSGNRSLAFDISTKLDHSPSNA